MIFIQAIAIEKTFINEEYLKENNVDLGFSEVGKQGNWSYISIMGVMTNNRVGSYLEICEVRVVTGG